MFYNLETSCSCHFWSCTTLTSPYYHLSITLLNLSLAFLKLVLPCLTFTPLSVDLPLLYHCLPMPPDTVHTPWANLNKPHQHLDSALFYRHTTVTPPSIMIISQFTQKSVLNRSRFYRELPAFGTVEVRRPLKYQRHMKRQRLQPKIFLCTQYNPYKDLTIILLWHFTFFCQGINLFQTKFSQRGSIVHNKNQKCTSISYNYEAFKQGSISIKNGTSHSFHH